jgi:hypothetical protein
MPGERYDGVHRGGLPPCFTQSASPLHVYGLTRCGYALLMIPGTARDGRAKSSKNRTRGIETARVEGAGVSLAPEGRQGKNRPGTMIAKGIDDVPEMDRPTIANGKLDLRLQPAGGQSGSQAKMKSVNSEN